MRIKRSLSLSSALVFVGSLASAQITEDYSLTAQPGVIADSFGLYMAGDGDSATVYSWTRLPGFQGPGAGSIHQVDFVGGSWQITEQFGATQPFPVLSFGTRLAMSGEWCTSLSGSLNPDGNLIYVYRRVNGVWSEFQVIDPGRRLQENGFYEVQLDGTTMVINGVGTPIVVFEFDGTQWIRTGRIQNNVLINGFQAADSRFVTIADGRVFEAAGSETPGFGGGREKGIRVYERFGTVWTLIDIVRAPSSGLEELFANRGIAADGPWLMASDTQWGKGRPGRVQIYRWNEVSRRYQLHSLVSAPNPILGTSPVFSDEFSYAMQVVDDRLLVGAPSEGSPFGVNRGAAFLFTYDAVLDEWVFTQEYRAADDPQNFGSHATRVGSSVALLNGAVLVGDWTGFYQGVRSGVVRVYENEIGTPLCTGTPAFFGIRSNLRATGDRNAADGEFQLAASFVPSSTPFLMLASPSTAHVPLPGGGSEFLCVGAPRRDTGGARITTPTGLATVSFTAWASPLGALVPGDTLYFQMWFRHAGAQPTGVTNAVEITFR